MRQLTLLSLVALLMLSACGPSAEAVQTAIAQTEIARARTQTGPVPVSIKLPGGWDFPLGSENLRLPICWPETECTVGPDQYLCNGVSLRWSVQLEALVRGFKPNDEIKLSLSTSDSLLYGVQSVKQVPSIEIARLAINSSPCLLVSLFRPDSATIWVVTAKP